MGEDYDYKDIYDFDLTKFENRDDYYEGLEDDSIIEKKFTEEELEDFKNKVKKYCENLIEDNFEDIFYVNDLSEDELAKRIFMGLENISGEEYFSETILEDFYGQQDLFFEYAKEIVPEIACEYKEERKREEKNEFINEIDKKFKESYSRSDVVEELIELLNENDSFKNIDEADVVRKFIFYRGDAYIPSEILDCIDLKLIQEDDALMEDLLGCWIAPNSLIDDLSEYMEEEREYGNGLKPYEIYENFGHYGNKYDFSEYYEKFYNKVISENINGVGTENYDYDEYHDDDDERQGDFRFGEEAYWKIFEKMPSRMLEIRGGLDNLTYEDQAYYFPIEFIIKKYVEANKIDDIEYLLKDEEDADIRVDTILEFFNRYKYELNQDNEKKLRNIVIDNIEECDESCKENFERSKSDTKEFIIESYVRCEKELPEDIKEIMNIKEEEIERIKKEYELEQLQEEDKKCDEALELAEKLDKNKEQEGQTQSDD